MRRHANDCPVFWKDDKPCNCAMAELAKAEADAARLRRALEKIRDDRNVQPFTVARLALRPDEQHAEKETHDTGI